jgi:hypothetical protein
MRGDRAVERTNLHSKPGFIPCRAIAPAVRRWLITGEEQGSIPGEEVIFVVEEVELEQAFPSSFVFSC